MPDDKHESAVEEALKDTFPASDPPPAVPPPGSRKAEQAPRPSAPPVREGGR